MSADHDLFESSGLLGSIQSVLWAALVGVVTLVLTGFAVMIRGLRRAGPGFETNDGYFTGVYSRPLTSEEYHQILVSLDHLLAIFKEPGTVLTDEDEMLHRQISTARAYSLRAESGHPFPSRPPSQIQNA